MLIWYRGFQCNSLWIHSYCRYRIQLAGIQEQHHNEKQSQTVSTHRGGESNGCWYWLCGSTLSNQTYQHIDSERPSRRKQIKEKPRAKSWNKKGAGIIKKVQWESICFRRRRHAKHFYSCRICVGDWATLPAHTEREGDCWIGQGSERSLSVTASLQRAQNHSNTVEQSKHTPPIFNFFH